MLQALRPAAVLCSLLAALTLLLPLPAAAQADTPEARLAAARKVVALMNELTGPDKMMAMMGKAMQAPLEQQLRSASHLTMAQRDRAAQVLSTALTEGMGEVMTRLMPDVYAAMTRVYVERFTLAEIEDVRRFYDSPAGRKSMIVVADDLPQLMQPMVQGMQAEAPKLQARIEAAIRVLANEGISLQPPAR